MTSEMRTYGNQGTVRSEKLQCLQKGFLRQRMRKVDKDVYFS